MQKTTILLGLLLVTAAYARPAEEAPAAAAADEAPQAEETVAATAEDTAAAATTTTTAEKTTTSAKKGRQLDHDTTSTTPREPKEVVEVLKFEHNKQPDGSFQFLYETGDQTYREETGTLSNAGTDDEALEVSGSYRYVDANGDLVEVHYTAGKNGFVPTGTHILSEITALAKAAADLPDISAQEVDEADAKQAREDHEVSGNRRSRAKAESEDKTETVKKIEKGRRGESTKTERKTEKTTTSEKDQTAAAAETIEVAAGEVAANEEADKPEAPATE